MVRPSRGFGVVFGAALVFFGLLPAGCSKAQKKAASSPATTAAGETSPADSLRIVMEPCNAKRPARISSDTGLVSLLFSSMKGEQLAKRGFLQLGEERIAVYLPKPPYTVTNSGDSDGHFDNKSTLLSIDQDGDGNLSQVESWFANLPVRVSDRMLEVASIADDGSEIVFKASSSPLQGVVVGRRCPSFEFETADGQRITSEQFKGKAVVFDIWSIT